MLNKDTVYSFLRIFFLEASFTIFLIWIYFGYDSTIGQLFGSDEIRAGLHWSTALSISVMLYFLTVNYHNGGLTFKELKHEFTCDLKNLIRFKPIYKNNSLGLNRALYLLLAVPTLTLFIFEIPYTLLYDIYQFNNILYPMWYNLGFIVRNISIPILASITILISLKYRNKEKYRFNLDRFFILTVFFTLIYFFIWINWNTTDQIQTASSIGLNPDITWILPVQKQFPQTVYSYYNSTYLSLYEEKNLFQFHIDNWIIHTLNIVCKTLIFAASTYIFSFKKD